MKNENEIVSTATFIWLFAQCIKQNRSKFLPWSEFLKNRSN